jgi:hypothetical protein
MKDAIDAKHTDHPKKYPLGGAAQMDVYEVPLSKVSPNP